MGSTSCVDSGVGDAGPGLVLVAHHQGRGAGHHRLGHGGHRIFLLVRTLNQIFTSTSLFPPLMLATMVLRPISSLVGWSFSWLTLWLYFWEDLRRLQKWMGK